MTHPATLIINPQAQNLELVYETTSTTQWFATHDAAMNISELVLARQLCTPACAWRLRLVLHELLRNAIEHGNLEVSGQNKGHNLEGISHYYQRIDQALTDPTLSQRSITVKLWFNEGRFIGLVQDEGLGFNTLTTQSLGLELIKKITTTLTHFNNGSGTLFTLEDKHDHP